MSYSYLIANGKSNFPRFQRHMPLIVFIENDEVIIDQFLARRKRGNIFLAWQIFIKCS